MGFDGDVVGVASKCYFKALRFMLPGPALFALERRKDVVVNLVILNSGNFEELMNKAVIKRCKMSCACDVAGRGHLCCCSRCRIRLSSPFTRVSPLTCFPRICYVDFMTIPINTSGDVPLRERVLSI